MTNAMYRRLVPIVGLVLIVVLLGGWVYVTAGNATPRPRDHYVPLTVPRTLPGVP